GAGSGKKSDITQKISYLINECGIAAQKIVGVTFTNKAAREMKERISRLLKERKATSESGRRLTVATFHHLGLTIIRHELRHIGLKSGFSIFDSQDALALLKSLMLKAENSNEEQLRWLQNQISDWKNNLLLPPQAMDIATESGDEQLMLAARVYEEYQRHLRAFNAVDFD